MLRLLNMVEITRLSGVRVIALRHAYRANATAAPNRTAVPSTPFPLGWPTPTTVAAIPPNVANPVNTPKVIRRTA
jgi:hypothetical protein